MNSLRSNSLRLRKILTGPVRLPVMLTPNSQGSGPAATTSTKPEKRELKILMLHGYTQSGPLFRSKTRALEKLLAKALARSNLSVTCLYPTAPIRLNAKDIPGYVAPSDSEQNDAASSTAAAASTTTTSADDDDESDSWAWFRKREFPDGTITYAGFETGALTVAAAIREAGGVDGILGFSQGGAMAALMASVLETPHRDVPPVHESWATELRDANAGRGLRFAAVYSGFFAIDPALAWCYEPPVRTPTIHFLGSLDTVVEEGRSRALESKCQRPTVIVHPGGHYVPISKEWAMALAGFVGLTAQEETQN